MNTARNLGMINHLTQVYGGQQLSEELIVTSYELPLQIFEQWDSKMAHFFIIFYLNQVNSS